MIKNKSKIDALDLHADLESKARKQAEEAEMEQKEWDAYNALHEQRHLQRAREDKERAEILRQQIAKLSHIEESKLEARVDKRDLGVNIESKVRKQAEAAKMEKKERDAYDALYEQRHLQQAWEDKERAEILRQQIARLLLVEVSKPEARVDKRDLGANIESKARKQAEAAKMEQKERDAYDALYEQWHLQRAREDKEGVEILRQQIAKLPQYKVSKPEARIDKRD